jgi:hypothetical protein
VASGLEAAGVSHSPGSAVLHTLHIQHGLRAQQILTAMAVFIMPPRWQREVMGASAATCGQSTFSTPE